MKVIDVAGQIRQRDVCEHLRRDRIDHPAGNHVARKRRPDDAAGPRIDDRRVRVVDRADAAVQHGLAEVPRTFRRGRHRADDGDRPLVVPLLVGREREQLVLLDREADRAAQRPECGAAQQLRILVGRELDGRVGERVHAGVAEEAIGRSLEPVRARLHVQADDAAEAVAVLGVHAVLRYRDFLDRVHGRGVGGLVAGAERHAVQQDVVGAVRTAARVVVVRERVVVWPVLGGRGPGGGNHGRIQVRQVVRISTGDRGLVDELARQRDVRTARVELDDGRGGLDGDRLLHAADFQHEVHRDVPALGDAHVLLIGPLEPAQFGRDGVATRVHEVEQVPALAVRDALGLHPRGVIDQRHRHTRKDALARVHDRALHAAAIILCGGRRAQQHEDRKRDSDTTPLHDPYLQAAAAGAAAIGERQPHDLTVQTSDCTSHRNDRCYRRVIERTQRTRSPAARGRTAP